MVEGLPTFCAGYHVPALFSLHLHKNRVAGCGLHAQDATFPLAKADFSQVGLQPGLHAQMASQGRRSLYRALQRGDVNRVDDLMLQPFAHGDGLSFAIWMQLRVAVSVYKGEGVLLGSGPRFAVANQYDFRGAFRWLV